MQRSAKFVKYLPDYGWRPIVLTLNRPVQRLRDETLFSEIPPDTVIIRTRTLEPPDDWRGPLRLLIWGPLTPLCVPDMGNWWLPWAIPAGLRQIRTRAVRVIYATGAPFSSHLLGAILKIRTGIPLVLDYRDEWTLNPLYWSQRRAYWVMFKPIERLLQRWVIGVADRVILVTDSARRAFVEAFGNPDKFVTIRNGYDKEDLERAIRPDLPADRLHIVYTGSTYELDSRPSLFLKGLRQAIDMSTSFGKNVMVHFVGELDSESRDLIVDLGLTPCVKAEGYVPHGKSVGYLKQADALLLISWSVSTRVPGKTYEYLAVRKPVLALMPRDAEPLRLLNETGAGIWLDPGNTSSIAAELIRLERLWRNGALNRLINDVSVGKYERKVLTGQLAQVFDAVHGSTQSRRNNFCDQT